jgi:predicted nucleic acid-binding protein
VRSVTADSNIWVSAFGYGGNPRRLIELADAGEIRIDISEFIIDEVLRTLREKFEWSAERLQEAADQMKAITRKVAPPEPWTFSRKIPRTTGFWNARRKRSRSTS